MNKTDIRAVILTLIEICLVHSTRYYRRSLSLTVSGKLIHVVAAWYYTLLQHSTDNAAAELMNRLRKQCTSRSKITAAETLVQSPFNCCGVGFLSRDQS
jgi:hypothetical protein